MPAAPHLPPKSCHIKTHNTLKSLPWILFIVAMSGLTSASVTLAAIVWLAPTLMPDQFVGIMESRSSAPKQSELDSGINSEVRRRIWRVYDTRKKINKRFYSDSADFYSAVMFSSDGWAVAYIPDYRPGLRRYWEGLDYQGVSYKVEKVVPDKLSGLFYVKFAGGEGLPFVSFADWNEIGSGYELWSVKAGKWHRHILEDPVIEDSSSKPYPIWRPRAFYYLGDGIAEGSVVVNGKGEFAGLSGGGGKLIYGWFVASQYASVLGGSTAKYTSLPWQGYMVRGFLDDKNFSRPISGFYVSHSPTGSSSSTVGVGDIILRAQNKPIDPVTISRDLIFAPEKIPVTVFRGGDEIDILVEKLEIHG